jgi:hypothetical protein
MAKIEQISHLTCKLKFLECPGVHNVSVCTVITAWLSDRKIFYRICSYDILELMQRVIFALPLNRYGKIASIVVKKKTATSCDRTVHSEQVTYFISLAY